MERRRNLKWNKTTNQVLQVEDININYNFWNGNQFHWLSNKPNINHSYINYIYLKMKVIKKAASLNMLVSNIECVINKLYTNQQICLISYSRQYSARSHKKILRCIFIKINIAIKMVQQAEQQKFRPAVYIPQLMNKSTFEDYSSEHIENIRKAIEYCLIKLSKITYFAQTVEFNVFITKTNKDSNQEIDYVQNKLKEMTQLTNIEQIDLRYKQNFEEFETKESVNEQQRQKCNDFSLLMSKLEQIKVNDFQDIKKLFEQHSKNVNYLSQYILPELHLLHLNLQSEEVIQRRKSNSIDRGLQMQIDTMNDVYDYFVTEQREASALSYCMNYIKDIEQQKNKLEQKIMSQKLNQEELNTSKIQFQSVSSIWSILVNSYANYYIDNYFKERYQLYLLMINRLAQIQINYLKLRQNFWQSI